MAQGKSHQDREASADVRNCRCPLVPRVGPHAAERLTSVTYIPDGSRATPDNVREVHRERGLGRAGGGAFNLARVVGIASPGHARARCAILRAKIINMPARIASSARWLTLHLPRDWPWADAWQALFDLATGPPASPDHLTIRPRGPTEERTRGGTERGRYRARGSQRPGSMRD